MWLARLFSREIFRQVLSSLENSRLKWVLRFIISKRRLPQDSTTNMEIRKLTWHQINMLLCSQAGSVTLFIRNNPKISHSLLKMPRTQAITTGRSETTTSNACSNLKGTCHSSWMRRGLNQCIFDRSRHQRHLFLRVSTINLTLSFIRARWSSNKVARPGSKLLTVLSTTLLRPRSVNRSVKISAVFKNSFRTQTNKPSIICAGTISKPG